MDTPNKDFIKGQNWSMTITIPGGVVEEFPDRVNALQNSIKMALMIFNDSIKSLTKEKIEMKTVEKDVDGLVTSDLKKQAILNRMKEHDEEERGIR